jgi:hypothetical protein
MTPVIVHRNLEGSFHAWICAHAEPQTPHEEGEITLCALCSDMIRNGGTLVDEDTGKPVPRPPSGEV